MRKSDCKIFIRKFLYNHHVGDVTCEVIMIDGEVDGIDLCKGNGRGVTIGLHGAIYDSEGDEVEKEQFLLEAQNIVNEHNAKYAE